MYKKKLFFIFLPFLTLSFCFTACTKPDITFGTDYLNNSFTSIVSVDTATPAISTVLVDSFVSSGTGRAVIGQYSDPYFGSVTAQSYFQLTPPAFSDVYSKSSYDSLELIIKPNKSYYGDTTRPLLINVYRLAEQIEYAQNRSSLYNVNSFATYPDALGSKSMVIRPSVTDTISIRLSDAAGKDLMDKFKNADDVIKTTNVFLTYFKGLRVSAGSSGYIFGFSDSIIMRLHYREPGVITQSKSIDFILSNSSMQFNQITADRSGSALSNLSSSNNQIPSSATNNTSFLQSVSGAVIKVSFPYLRNFLQIPQYVKLVRAQLVITPLRGSFNNNTTLPPYIRLSSTTYLNQFGADLTATGAGGASTVQYGNLVIDNLYGVNTKYTYDVTAYITGQLAIEQNNSNGVLLSPPAPANTTNFNRLILGDNHSATPGVQLQLYYLTVSK